MADSKLRFRPPLFEPTPEMSWVLARAFATGTRASPPPADVARLLTTARGLGLSSRIAARLGRDRLVAELGEPAAAAFGSDRAQICARSMLLRETIREVTAVASQTGIPIVLLKFAALDASGFLLEGSRPAGDVDVLAPAGRAQELAAALRSAGFRSTAAPGYEHHLPALRGAHGIVEVHRRVLGVRLGGTRASATLEELESAALLSAAPARFGLAAVPARQVLVAHALVHGLGQHGFSPRAYPLATLLADLQDLGCAEAGGTELIAAITPWIRRALPAPEVDAARALVSSLADGREMPAGAGLLLNHLLAGTFDAAYAATLKVRRFRYPLSDHPTALAALAGMWSALRFAGRPAPESGDAGSTGRRLFYLLAAGLRGLRQGPAREAPGNET